MRPGRPPPEAVPQRSTTPLPCHFPFVLRLSKMHVPVVRRLSPVTKDGRNHFLDAALNIPVVRERQTTATWQARRAGCLRESSARRRW
jgi:hypothetical protein